MKYIYTILVFAALLFSEPLITDALINKADALHGRFVKARLNALGELVQKLQNKPKAEMLKQVNIFFNRAKYKEDIDIYGSSDYWATPYEFLINDAGDCEDFVIAKYLTLIELGFSKDKLYLTYVRIEGRDDAHMVLTYFETKNSMPLVLDNFNKRLLPASQRADLKPVYNFNPNLLEEGKKTHAHRQWDDLIKRFKEKKL